MRICATRCCGSPKLTFFGRCGPLTYQRNLTSRGLAAESVQRRIDEMRRAFPDAGVTGYEQLIPAMTCDAKDRHVLAAAIRGGAGVLVTFNVKDFPVSSTAPFDVVVVHPDDFLLDQLDLHPEAVHSALGTQVAAYRSPPHELHSLLEQLEASQVPRFAKAIATQMGPRGNWT